MECPKCGYEPTMAEQIASADSCPQCRVVYADYDGEPDVGDASVKDKMTRGIIGAQLAVEQGRQQRKESVQRPTPVVVVDFNMSFMAMVGFLVKLTFAAIPAAIIVFFIVSVVLAFIGYM